MLPVAIHLHCDIIVMRLGIQIPGLHAAANTQIDRQVQIRCMPGAQDIPGRVPGTVVDDDVIIGAIAGIQFVEQGADVFFLVIGRNDQ